MATYMVKDELYTVDTWDINSIEENTLRSAIVEKYMWMHTSGAYIFFACGSYVLLCCLDIYIVASVSPHTDDVVFYSS